MSVDLSGRVVLVTGGTKGLGRGLAQAFREAGASVMICARHEAEVPIEAFVAADLRDSTAADGVVEATVSRFGRLDVVTFPHPSRCQVTVVGWIGRYPVTASRWNGIRSVLAAVHIATFLSLVRRGVQTEHERLASRSRSGKEWNSRRHPREFP